MKMQDVAIALVREYVENEPDRADEPQGFDVYVVWFAKTLQNWKALLGTTRDDGLYFEVTYNGDKREAYLDVYAKVTNEKHVIL